ncbi:Transmembrane protein [Plasmodiophora brassicae]|uniref:Transmembrane protein n=1 Tax=Plasmodiophora brassicae TaxID=37360 RepID=A0A0G4IJS9_PLABS|nr:hypothetical protein PBRA_004103 [Plasmodiophora brassicae]SPQ96213.1 unnamed protein product [Plasmodiophora brassicae]
MTMKAALDLGRRRFATFPKAVFENVHVGRTRQRTVICALTNVAMTAGLVASWTVPSLAVMQPVTIFGSLAGIALIVVTSVTARREVARIVLLDENRVQFTTYKVTGALVNRTFPVDTVKVDVQRLADKTSRTVPINVVDQPVRFLLAKHGTFQSPDVFERIFKVPYRALELSKQP